MIRSEMVTRSHPTHSAPNGGCSLLGNNRGSANSSRETTQAQSGSSSRIEGIW